MVLNYRENKAVFNEGEVEADEAYSDSICFRVPQAPTWRLVNLTASPLQLFPPTFFSPIPLLSFSVFLPSFNSCSCTLHENSLAHIFIRFPIDVLIRKRLRVSKEGCVHTNNSSSLVKNLSGDLHLVDQSLNFSNGRTQ